MIQTHRRVWKALATTAAAIPLLTLASPAAFAAAPAKTQAKVVTLSVYLGPLAPTASLVKSVANPYPQGALYQIAKDYEKLHPNVHINVLPQVSIELQFSTQDTL
ncbi:MAG: hypothetical protein ACYCVB_10275 [Bacilli bacterium]